MLTKASSTCRPAPVRPPPGDSSGDNRQPLVIALRVFVAVVTFDVEDRPELAARQRFAQRADRWPEAPVMADGEHHAGVAAGAEHPRRVGARQRQRLLAEDLLSAPRRRRSPAPDAANAASPAAPRRWRDRRARHRDRRSGRDRCRAQNSCAAFTSGSTARMIFSRGWSARLRPDCGPSGRGRRSRHRIIAIAPMERAAAGSPR